MQAGDWRSQGHPVLTAMTVRAGMPRAEALATHRTVSTHACGRDRPAFEQGGGGDSCKLPINEHGTSAQEKINPCEPMMPVPIRLHLRLFVMPWNLVHKEPFDPA